MAETTIDVKSLSNEVQKAIAGLKDNGDAKTQGIVTRVGDGVAWIYGLRDAGYSEMLEIEGNDGKKVTALRLKFTRGRNRCCTT